ncbi:hypothetical protein MKW92_025677, partial [Papaver armeniacum]
MDLKVKIKKPEKNQVLIQKAFVDLKQKVKQKKEEIVAEKNKIEKVKWRKGMYNQRMMMIMMMMILMMPTPALSKAWTVGGNHGWSPYFNYTNWSEDICFVKDDWL